MLSWMDSYTVCGDISNLPLSSLNSGVACDVVNVDSTILLGLLTQS